MIQQFNKKLMFEFMKNQLNQMKDISEEAYKRTLDHYIEKFPKFKNFYLKGCKVE